MWRRFGILTALLLGLATAVSARAQILPPAPEPAGNADASPGRVIGEVTATDPAEKKITINSDAGGTVTIILQEKTVYLRVPPGERDLKKAVKITPGEINIGDRVLARGRWAEGQRTIPAVAVIVMTRAELAQKRQQESAEWQKRALGGAVSALNPATKEITVSVRSPEGTRMVVVEPAERAVFHRYAPDSVRFRDAQASSFAELKVGDSLRILGERSADGARIKPEQIVSGSFRNIAGIINAIDGAAGEIKITDLQTKKQLIVRIDSSSVVRRMPPATASATGNRAQAGGGGTAAAGRAGSGGPPAGEPRPGAPARQPSQADAPATESGARATRGGAPGGGKGMNLEQMPALSFAELKRGEAVLVLSTAGADPSRVTAIVLVAGVESLLSSAADNQPQIGGVWNFFDISLP